MIYAIIVKKLKGRQKEKYMGLYIYWLILFGITEYIIYISFISSITKQVDDEAYIKDKMYSLKLKGIISSDIKHIITGLILISYSSYTIYCIIIYDNLITCFIWAVILVIINRKYIASIYGSVAAVTIYLNVIINSIYIVKEICIVKSNNYQYYPESIISYVVPFVVFISIIYIFFFIRYNNYRRINMSKITSLAIITTCIIQSIMLILLRLLISDLSGKEYILCLIIMFAACIAKNMICIFMIEINENVRYNYEKDVLKIEIDTNNRLCENIKEAQEELKDIRHDLKNRLNTLSYAIQLKDYSEAEKELGNILDNINIVGKPKYCANLRINSILEYKLGNISKNVNVMSRINIPDDIEVDYADLNVLIGNLIDNSIQAVMRAIQYDKPAYIDIELIYYAGNIVFRIKNSYIEVTEKKDEEYYKYHGRGIRSVKKILKKLNGTYDVNKTDCEYETCISFNIRDSKI